MIIWRRNGGTKIMRNSSFFILMGLLMMLFGGIIISITIMKNKPKMNHERISFLRDSLEMEYYKKQLESYPFDHSKIKDTTVIEKK
jgi:ABC-type glycerol-3-phosphate transport system permease component